MKTLNLTTLILVIIGGLNWGVVGLFHRDMVASILGATSMPARLIYILIGLSALWQLIPFFMSVSTDEPTALRGHSAH